MKNEKSENTGAAMRISEPNSKAYQDFAIRKPGKIWKMAI
jgi:hypothetical protein